MTSVTACCVNRILYADFITPQAPLSKVSVGLQYTALAVANTYKYMLFNITEYMTITVEIIVLIGAAMEISLDIDDKRMGRKLPAICVFCDLRASCVIPCINEIIITLQRIDRTV